jgi:hypothetical protein
VAYELHDQLVEVSLALRALPVFAKCRTRLEGARVENIATHGAGITHGCVIGLLVEDFEMIDNGSSQISAMVATAGLQSSPNPLELELRPIAGVGSFRFASWFEQSVRIVLTTVVLLLLFPTMLTLSLLAIVVARVFGVPLYASASSSPLVTTKKSEIG